MVWPKGRPGVAKRTYPVDDHYLDSIDTEAKAYFLGFFCADGYLTSRDPNQFGVDVNFVDRDILEVFRREFGHRKPPYPTNHGMYRFRATSRHITAKLREMGIDHRKSYTLGRLSVQLPCNLHSHFVRGHFDGDGGWCLTTAGRNNPKLYMSVQIRATPAFCEYLASLMPHIELNYAFHATGLLYSKRKAVVEALGNWLYADSHIYLKRKFDKFKSYMSGTETVGNQSGTLGSQDNTPQV